MNRPNPSHSILAVSHDPGGAEVLEPVVEALGKGEPFHTERFHTPENRPFEDWKREAKDRLRSSPDLLLTATSHGSSLEKAFIREAALQGIPSITLLDSWSNYRSRFLEPGEEMLPHFLPSVIGVMDDFAAREMGQAGFPEERLRQVGQPGFDRFLQWAQSPGAHSIRAQIRSEQGVASDEKLILFFSQPILDMDGPVGSPTYRGYVEADALKFLMQALAGWKNPSPFRLMVKLHPKEKPGKYEKLLETAPIRAQSFDSAHADMLLLASDIAAGMTSTMLVKGALLNRPQVSIQPNQQGEERLMLIRRGFLRPCGNVREIQQALETAWQGRPEDRDQPSLSPILGDGQATRRILDEIRCLLKIPTQEVSL